MQMMMMQCLKHLKNNRKRQTICKHRAITSLTSENMKNQRLWNCYLCSWVVIGILSFGGCARKSTIITKLPPFSVKEKFAGGELRQVIQVTNGMSLYFTKSNVVVWFCEGNDTVLSFDSDTLVPSSILLEKAALGDQPGQSILDINADGIPDIREIKSKSLKQIFYRGDWYTREKEGTQTIITVDGNKRRVHFDGSRWVEVSTNEVK
jgi:hypothetical protein